MKKKRIVMGALALAVLAATFFACTKETDKRFSCDPKISKWAAKNMKSFETASREQLSELPLSFQKASYLTLDPERRLALWNEKLEIVKRDWHAPVVLMIEDLQQHMRIDWFDGNALANEDYDYLNEWQEVMLRQHMDTIDYAISFMQLATEEELEELFSNSGNHEYSWMEDYSLLEEYEKAAPGGDYKPNCKCEWNITCGLINAGLCVSPTEYCNETYKDCGLLYAFPCKGYCEYHIVEQR